MAVNEGEKAKRKPLSPRHRRFVLEYVKDFNGTKACIRAGYTDNEPAAATQAGRLLKNAEIKRELAKAIRKQERQLEVSPERILRELARVGYSDPSRIVGKSGNLLPLRNMPEDVRRSISSLEVMEITADDGPTTFVKKIKFWPKVEALNMLGKHKKLFAERMEHSGPDGGPIEVSDARARLAEKLAARRASGGGGRGDPGPDEPGGGSPPP